MRKSLFLAFLLILVVVVPALCEEPSLSLDERLSIYRKNAATKPFDAFKALQPVDDVKIVDLLASVFVTQGGTYTYAANALRTAKGEEVIERINYHAEKASQDAVRLGFIIALQTLAPPSSLDMLLERANREREEDIQYEIILALRNYKSDKVNPVLFVLSWRSRSEKNSRMAIIALASSGMPDAGDLLYELYTGKRLSAGLRAEALNGLHICNHKNLRECVESGIEDRELEPKITAFTIAGERGYKEFGPKIIEELFSSRWEIRITAVRVCGMLKLVDSVEYLIKLWSKEDGRVGEEIHNALLKITGKSLPPNVKHWEAWFENLEEPLQETEKEGEYIVYHGTKTKSKNICFLVDISGSMSAKANTTPYAGEGKSRETTRMEIVKEELIRVVASLPKDAYFNVISFETQSHKWRDSQVRANDSERSSAVSWIKSLSPTGGTELFKGLMEAFGDLDDKDITKRPDTIFVLSDGTPNLSAFRTQAEMLSEIGRINRVRLITIHTIGIGTSGQAFLEPLALQNFGTYRTIN